MRASIAIAFACCLPGCSSSLPQGADAATGPSCSDRTRSGDETDVDCGGAACPSCADGSRCAASTDCLSGYCFDGTCVPRDCPECRLPHARPGCDGARCTIAQCAHGYLDCDGIASNGCETDVAHDASSCGACNHPCGITQGCWEGVCSSEMHECPGPCLLPHSAALCRNGVCALVVCDTNYFNCDQETETGCEVDTASDPRSCGSCFVACAPGQTCRSGQCQ